MKPMEPIREAASVESVPSVDPSARGRIRAWMRGLDPPIYVVGLFPPLVGAAATLSTPHPLPYWAWPVVTGAFLLLHTAVNVYNDAFDAGTKADRVKHH